MADRIGDPIGLLAEYRDYLETRIDKIGQVTVAKSLSEIGCLSKNRRRTWPGFARRCRNTRRTTAMPSSTTIVATTVNNRSRVRGRKDVSTRLQTLGWPRSSACVGRPAAPIALRWSERRSWMGVSIAWCRSDGGIGRPALFHSSAESTLQGKLTAREQTGHPGGGCHQRFNGSEAVRQSAPSTQFVPQT